MSGGVKILERFKSPSLFIPLINLFIGLGIVVLFNAFDQIAYKKRLDKELMDDAPAFIREQAQVLGQFTGHSRDVITAIAGGHDMARYLETGERSGLDDLIRSFITAESYLMQLRFIDAKGMEKIRFDRREPGGEILRIPDDALQDKSRRNYVVANLNRPARIWFSDLDLNVERGQIMASRERRIRT